MLSEIPMAKDRRPLLKLKAKQLQAPCIQFDNDKSGSKIYLCTGI